MSPAEAARLLVSSPFVKDYYLGSDGYYYYSPSYYYYPDDYYDANSNWDDFSWGDTAEGLPEYNPDKDLAGDDNILDWAYYFKYVINIWLIAVPYTIIGAACMSYNLYFNIEWNKMWAGANYWLIGNSVFLLIEYIISVLLAFELPIFMDAFVVVRVFAVALAIVYNVLYFLGLFEWLDMLYLVTDKSAYDFVTVYINMLLGYNIVLHSTVIPVTLFIIIKEVSLLFF